MGLTVRSSHPITAFPFPLEHHRFKGAQSDTIFGFAISLLGFFYIVTFLVPWYSPWAFLENLEHGSIVVHLRTIFLV